MHHFEYRDGHMFAEDVDLTALAGEVGTPFYVYSAATLRRHVRVMREASADIDTLLAYAMKANSNQAVLKVLANEGAGADVVSGGELERVIAARPRAMGNEGPVDAQARDEKELAGALRHLAAVAEAYPDLKADRHFLELQDQLTETEDRIARLRQIRV